MTLEVQIFSYANPNTRLDVLQNAIDVRVLEELEGLGAGSFTILADDPKIVEDPSLLDYRNVVKVLDDNTVVGAFIIQQKKSVRVKQGDKSARAIEVSGEGLRAWFRDAAVRPAGGVKKGSMEERYFNFSTERGDWYKTSQWVEPKVINRRGDIAGLPWRYGPKDWPDYPNAKWIWGQSKPSSNYNQPVGDNYFRLEFTAVQAKYSFFMAADDGFELYLDGQLMTTSLLGSDSWSNTHTMEADLEAGPHVIGVRVQNAGGAAAFIGALAYWGDPEKPEESTHVESTGYPADLAWAQQRVTETTSAVNAAQLKYDTALNYYNSLPNGSNKKGATTTQKNQYKAKATAKTKRDTAKKELDAAKKVRDAAIAERTLATNTDSKWKVCVYPTQPPGWTVGEILHKLLDEADDRGVRFPDWLTPTFTNTHDSNGTAWDRELEWSFGVGAEYTEVIDKLEELACDVWVDPETLELHAWVKRGVDRSEPSGSTDAVVFREGFNLTSASEDGEAELKNTLLVQTNDGFLVQSDTLTSIAKYGVIEGKLETRASETLSKEVAKRTFEKKSHPATGASYEIIPTEGAIPGRHFLPGDWTKAPDAIGALVKRRIMSISYTVERDTGATKYAVEFDVIWKDREDENNRWLQRALGGSLGKQTSNSGSPSSGVNSPGTTGGGSPTTTIYVPSKVLNVQASSEGYWRPDGSQSANVTLTWDEVVTYTQGATATIEAYEVWASKDGGAFVRLGTTDELNMTLTNFDVDVEWQFKVRAVSFGKGGEFSDVIDVLMSTPLDVLPAPSKPTITSRFGTLRVHWDGLMADGETPDAHFRHIYAVASDVPGDFGVYVPVGQTISKAGSIVVTGYPKDALLYIKFYAVDHAGNTSPASEISDALVIGVTGPDIVANSVTANEIEAGAIQGEHLNIGAHPPQGTPVNRIPAPLTDEPWWTNAAPLITWSMGAHAWVRTTATTSGLILSRTSTERAVAGLTAMHPVPASGKIVVTWLADTTSVNIQVRQRDESGTSTWTNLTNGGVFTLDPDTVTYGVLAIFQASASAPSEALLVSAACFEVIGAGQNLQRAELSPAGLALFNDNGDQVIDITTASSNYIHIQAYSNGVGRTVASLNETGSGTFQDVDVAEDYAIRGTTMVGTLNSALTNGDQYLLNGETMPLLDRLSRDVIYRARWTSMNNVTVSTQYYRFAAGTFTLEPNRLYEFVLNTGAMLLNNNQSGVNVYVELRLGHGTTGNVSSGTAWIRALVSNEAGQGGGFIHAPLVVSSTGAYDATNLVLPPNTDLFWQVQTNLSSAPAAAMLFNQYVPNEFYIKDVGPARTLINATNRASSGAGVAEDPESNVTTKTITHTASWHQTWGTSSAYPISGSGSRDLDGRLLQGGGSGLNKITLLGFPAAVRQSGFRITNMQVRLRNRHTYTGGTTTFLMGTHGATGPVGSKPSATNTWTGSTGLGQDKWYTIPSQYYTGFANGQYDGITVGHNPGGSNSNYALFDGTTSSNYYGSSVRPQIKVTYKSN